MEFGFGLNLTFFSLFSLALVIIFFFKWFFSALSPAKKILPPSPPRLPIIGNLHQVGLLPHRSLQSLSRKYGPLMMLRFGSTPVLVASSPDAVREIMKNHDLTFSSRPKSEMVEKIWHGSIDVAFAPYGEHWRQLKSLCVLHLLSNKRVQSFHHIRVEETSRMIEKIRHKCSSSSLVNLSEILATVTNDIIVRITLGRRFSDGEYSNKTVAVIAGMGDLVGSMNVADYIPWLAWVNRFNGLYAKAEKVSKDIDELMDAVIEQHRIRKKEDRYSDDTTETRGSALADILLEIGQESFTSFPLELATIKAVLLDMIAAGTDTTRTLMDWVMVELLRHPKIMEKLQTEVRQVAQEKSVVTENDLLRMPYLKAVIKETSRLHSPVPLLVPRESTQDVKVMGYDISQGTQVIVNAWAIGRDPNIWEKPEEFLPERFLNTNVDFRGFHFELTPFGTGRRMCPGISFAVAVNELVLARLLQSFNLSLPEGVKPEEMNMTENNGNNGKRKLPLLVLVSPYSS